MVGFRGALPPRTGILIGPCNAFRSKTNWPLEPGLATVPTSPDGSRWPGDPAGPCVGIVDGELDFSVLADQDIAGRDA